MKPSKNTEKVVQSFNDFDLVHVFNKRGEFLYPTTREKKLPTAESNHAQILSICGEQTRPYARPNNGKNVTGVQPKFSDEQIKEIRKSIELGFTNSQISKTLNVSPSTIRSIKLGISYSHVY